MFYGPVSDNKALLLLLLLLHKVVTIGTVICVIQLLHIPCYNCQLLFLMAFVSFSCVKLLG